ncbi:MAG: LemA family protein [Comamonas sp.]
MSGFFGFLASLFWFAVIIAAILGFVALKSYNKLQALGQRLREASSNTEVAVSRKLSLINQLIDVVRNYQDFEQFTHLKVSGDNTESLSQAWSQAGQVLSSIQGLAQRFPELRASEQYTNLASSIQVSEQAIMDARERYNAAVRDYNTARSSIPTVFVARFLGFSEAPYLEFDHSGVGQVTTLKDFKTGDGERLQLLLQGAGTKLVDSSRAVAAGTMQAGRALQERLQTVTQDATEAEEATGAAPAPAAPAAAAAPQFFYMQPGGVPQGPVPLAQLQQLIADGDVGPDAQIAPAGSNAWQAVRDWQASA